MSEDKYLFADDLLKGAIASICDYKAKHDGKNPAAVFMGHETYRIMARGLSFSYRTIRPSRPEITGVPVYLARDLPHIMLSDETEDKP